MISNTTIQGRRKTDGSAFDVEDELNKKIGKTEVVNNLASNDATKPLSAAMGKSLLEIAEGKTNSFTFDTEELFDVAVADWENPVSNPKWYEGTLKNGDVALIVELDKPDRWYNEYSGKWELLETSKVNLPEYLTKEEAQTQFETKLDKITTTDYFDRLYGISAQGVQTAYVMHNGGASAGTIPKRTATAGADGLGAPMFTGTPTSDGHAANKKYVDDTKAPAYPTFYNPIAASDKRAATTRLITFTPNANGAIKFKLSVLGAGGGTTTVPNFAEYVMSLYSTNTTFTTFDNRHKVERVAGNLNLTITVGAVSGSRTTYLLISGIANNNVTVNISDVSANFSISTLPSFTITSDSDFPVAMTDTKVFAPHSTLGTGQIVPSVTINTDSTTAPNKLSDIFNPNAGVNDAPTWARMVVSGTDSTQGGFPKADINRWLMGKIGYGYNESALIAFGEDTVARWQSDPTVMYYKNIQTAEDVDKGGYMEKKSLTDDDATWVAVRPSGTGAGFTPVLGYDLPMNADNTLIAINNDGRLKTALTVGSASQPIYLKNGVPTVCDELIARVNSLDEQVNKGLPLSKKTFAQLKAAANAIAGGENPLNWNLRLGDEVSWDIDGFPRVCQIVGFAHDNKVDGGKAGISFMMKDLLPISQQMNTTNTSAGGWNSSALRGRMNTYLSTMPQELQNIIETVLKTTANNGSQNGAGFASRVDSKDKLWLPSQKELSSNDTGVIFNEGARYSYWASKDNNAGRVKSAGSGGSSLGYWWLRSPDSSTTSAFRAVSNDGILHSDNASNLFGVCLGFCV